MFGQTDSLTTRANFYFESVPTSNSQKTKELSKMMQNYLLNNCCFNSSLRVILTLL